MKCADLFREVITRVQIYPNTERLRQRREQLNLSQRAVALRAKITPQYYGDIEQGKACSKEVAEAIMRALEL